MALLRNPLFWFLSVFATLTLVGIAICEAPKQPWVAEIALKDAGANFEYVYRLDPNQLPDATEARVCILNEMTGYTHLKLNVTQGHGDRLGPLNLSGSVARAPGDERMHHVRSCFVVKAPGATGATGSDVNWIEGVELILWDDRDSGPVQFAHIELSVEDGPRNWHLTPEEEIRIGWESYNVVVGWELHGMNFEPDGTFVSVPIQAEDLNPCHEGALSVCFDGAAIDRLQSFTHALIYFRSVVSWNPYMEDLSAFLGARLVKLN
jgi:hypothetical protein